MPARQETRLDEPEPPQEFRAAVAGLRAARFRPQVLVEEMPAPQRIAPYSCALAADVSLDDVEVGGGRLVLLHDPDGQDAWEGTFRCVAYARAEVDPEQVRDEALAEVGWSWLLEALEARGAAMAAPSGTVTSVASESFGGLAPEGPTAQLEIRASWSPVATDGEALTSGDIAAHAEAWGDLLCAAAGMEPLPEGVATLPTRRGQRGRG
ncbi:hypothetical protein GCM10011519_08040 [Marmoricola endophyticus]|uniref:DUF3000 domain-containing protein n=1 Tax=Marmoricola endophyticus TaxID=2040280 RepID=A0A917F0R2_9ACTN|nr:DUF3000 domain-containing protein [Marmoricola endophyticus]GGF36902.1 hypothetical protein GCM10011519_08040 [Marmoricola endophyticus]